jgi:hypothetical protein
LETGGHMEIRISMCPPVFGKYISFVEKYPVILVG